MLERFLRLEIPWFLVLAVIVLFAVWTIIFRKVSFAHYPGEETYEALVTRSEAETVARNAAKRDLVLTPDSISYVAFDPDLEDFCRCEFRPRRAVKPNRQIIDEWVLKCEHLPLRERQPDESITDERISDLARGGKTVLAIRLYMILHGTGLEEAESAIKRLA